MPEDEYVVYRLFAATGELLYVGSTCDLRGRLKDHAASKPWWPDVASKSVADYRSRKDADEAEAEAIVAECPRFNREWRKHAWDRPPFGTELRKLRLGRGLSQDELTSRTRDVSSVKLSTQEYIFYEKARVVPALDKFAAVCAALALTDEEVVRLVRLSNAPVEPTSVS